MKNDKISGLVYSTDQGRMCPVCGNPTDQCVCKQDASVPQGDGIVRVGRETKGRKGKTVTIITGIPLLLIVKSAYRFAEITYACS